jgi:Carboxypeptidase regulatory-like domain
MKLFYSRDTFVSLCLYVVAMVVLLFSTVGVQTAKADNLYAKIQGTVTDPTGAVLNGVKLTATNVDTGVAYASETKSDGLYVFLNLPIGTYKVTATSSGFRTFTATGITLVLDQIYALNIKMELGQVSEQVLVEASNVQVETTNTQLGTVMNGDTIVDMPLNGRNWTQLQLLQPGVMASSDRFGTYSTNGSQSQQNSFLINGQDSNDLPLNTPLIIPSPDAIAEFSMVTDTINPEYGRNSGAIMNAAIKSGTNQFHGAGFDFYRDTFLNDKDFFTQAPAVFHQNQFGGVIGGPIWKNKAFFFFSYQGARFRQPQTANQQTVYSQTELGGNFGTGADLGFNGAAPATPGAAPTNPGVSPFPMFGDSASTCPVSGGVMCPAGTYYGKAYDNSGTLLSNGLFSTGVVPTQDFNALSVKLVNQFVPLPNGPNNAYNFTAVSPGKTDQYLWQVDYNISSSDIVRSYGFIQSSPSTATLPFTGATLPGFPETDQRHSKQFTASWTHTFGPSLVNELRIGYTRFNFAAVEPENPVIPSSYGFTGINVQSAAGAGLPVMTVSGNSPGQVSFTLGFSANGPQPRLDQTYQLDDNFSWVMGRHTLKVGYDGRRFHVTNPFFFNNDGSFGFGAGGQFTTGNAGADFLLGIPDSYAQSSGGFIDAGAQEHYIYAQDSWKATSSLTINYGLAWQINGPLTDHFNGGRAINCYRPGEQSAIYPTAPIGLVFPGDTGCTNSGISTGFTHFGPRLGIAGAPHASGLLGRLTGDQGKFSIRTGVGIYYNQVEEELSLQNLTAPPFSLSDSGIGDLGATPAFASPFNSVNPANVSFTAYNGTSATSPTKPVTLGAASIPNKYPFTPPPAGSAVDFTFFAPMSLNVLDPRFAVPYSVNYNLTIQRELPGQMVLSVGYVGSQGRHLERAYELNPALPGACAAIPTCIGTTGERAQQGFFFAQNFKNPLPIPGTNELYLGSVGQQATDGNSNYNSLQVSLNKRVSHGLQFTLSYTYAHAEDDGSSFENSAFGTRGTNPFINKLNWGDSGFDARQRLVAGYQYEIPVPHALTSNGALSRAFKGWRVAGNTTLQSGFPINLSDSGFRSGTCWEFSFYGCPDNPNQVGPITKVDPRFVNPTTLKTHVYFLGSAFAKATPGTFGNTGRDSFHGPGINFSNIALMKDIPIKESMRIELRLETFNTFNHVNFNLPSGNVNSSLFGTVTGDTLGPRLVQLAGKFYF